MGSREFGVRTGNLRLIHFDQGVVEGLGAQLDEKNQYYLPLVDNCGVPFYIEPEGSEAPEPITRALVVFKQSEPTHTEWDLPSVLIIRDDWTPALQRQWSPTEAYRVPAEGAVRVSAGGCLGWNCYETKDKEWPYDFSYTIECWSRYRVVAQMLAELVAVNFPPQGSMTVVDDLGVSRTYHAFLEGTADLTEINSLVDRVCGYSINVRVEGELTGSRVPELAPAFTGGLLPPGTGPVNPGDPDDPDNPGDPDPGTGGRFGEGQPIKRVTLIGADE